jgi:FtsP/CotA-like multicopper oxidase with cupredoxin domain
MSTSAASTENTVKVRLEPAETKWEIARRARSYRGIGTTGRCPAPAREGHSSVQLPACRRCSPRGSTSIHWDGLRVPADMDCTELVQKPIQPGETFEYPTKGLNAEAP